MARRVSKPYAAGERGKSLGSVAARKPAPPAPRKNKRGARHLVQCRPDQVDGLVGPDGVTLAMRREQFCAAIEAAGVASVAFQPLAEMTLRELHHWHVCAQLVHLMSPNAERLHIRRGKLVLDLLTQMGLSPLSAQSLGLMQAREMQARHETMAKPVRSSERAREVAGLLDRYGILPHEDVTDAEVVEDAQTDDTEEVSAIAGTPEPLPDSAQREVSVSAIFDRGL
jgi:hypothetical protein